MSSERYFFVWVDSVLHVLVYVEKERRWGGSVACVRIEEPKAKKA